MATKWQKIKIDLSGYGLSPDQKDEVADLIIERIVNRTDQGKDKDGRKFAGYSKSYKESLDFKVAGKTNKVDLQLSGDMLAALSVLDQTSRSVVIGFERGSEENAKADGNIRGTYGKPTPDPKKARDFLGISERELIKIVKFVQSEDEKIALKA
jgi:hypothetical protein